MKKSNTFPRRSPYDIYQKNPASAAGASPVDGLRFRACGGSRSHTQSITYGRTHTHTDAYTQSDADSNSYTHTNADPYTYTNSNSNTGAGEPL